MGHPRYGWDFTHLKTGDTAKERTPLLTTILADAINLGLTKMAESCPGASYSKLSWASSCSLDSSNVRRGLVADSWMVSRARNWNALLFCKIAPPWAS
jgi:hypothetical protein